MFWNLSWTSISVLLFGILIAPIAMGLFNRGNHFPLEGKTVLLTGASSGMGKAVAKIVSQKGANVIIVARDVAKMKTVLDEMKTVAKSPAQRFHSISADVSMPTEAMRIVAEAIQWNKNVSPDVVWCIAGGSYPKLFLESSQEKLRQQMDLNYWSCADMAHAILGEWLKPATARADRPRHLIFTASSLAFYSIAGYSPYSPAKAALRSLCDTLRQEILLYSSTVKIHTIFPGSIDSPGYATENLTKPAITLELEKDDPVQTPEVVAEKAIFGLEQGEYFVTVNFLASAMRGCAWAGSPRNNWVTDTILTWITSLAWFFIGTDLDGRTVKYGQKHGHPSAYSK